MASATTTTSTSIIPATTITTATSIPTRRPETLEKMDIFLHQTPLDRRSFFAGIICCLFLLAPLFYFFAPRVAALALSRSWTALQRAKDAFRREKEAFRRNQQAFQYRQTFEIQALEAELRRLNLITNRQNEEAVAIWWKNTRQVNLSMQNIQDRQNLQDEMMRLHVEKREFAGERQAFYRQQAHAQAYQDATMRQIAAESADLERFRAQALLEANQHRERMRFETWAYINIVAAGDRVLGDYQDRIRGQTRERIRAARVVQRQAMLATAELIRTQRAVRRENQELYEEGYLVETWLARTTLFE